MEGHTKGRAAERSEGRAAAQVDWQGALAPVVIVGATATGKTAAALALAEQINGEIVNADSVQVYRGMDIGSAKPDVDARRRCAFHLLDVVSPDQQFTVSDWKQQAEAALCDIQARGKRPLVCGGTGLYIRALLEDWSLAAAPADAGERARLQQEADRQGSPALHARLQNIDPETAARLHPNDAVRIIRALEVWHVTGRPISQYQAEDRARREPRPVIRFGLTMPRPALYERIDRRVDAMLRDGLETETRGLLAQGYSSDLGSLRSLGYKEMAAYVLGAMTQDAAIAAIKLNTRHYARRQETWFRADKLIRWLAVADRDAADIATEMRASL